MKGEKAREYLERYRFIVGRLNRMRIDMQWLSDTIGCIHAIKYDAVSVQSTPENRMENNIIRALDRANEAARDIDELQRSKREIESRIDGMPLRESRILSLVYIEGFNLKQAALRMPYRGGHLSYDRTRHVISEALEHFEEKYLG